jgi:hypothetical protein
LPKYLSEQPRDATDRREAVGVLALEREQKSIDGDRRRVGPPRHEAIEQSIVSSREEVH